MPRKTSESSAATIGAGLAAVSLVAAAGYYFYASDDAKKNRKKAARWATSLKSEVVKRARQVPNIDAGTISRIVDEASLAYASAKNIDRSDLAAVAAELKRHWDRVGEEARKTRASLKRASKARPRKTKRPAARTRSRARRSS